MAIDTANKRRGAMTHLNPLRLYPVPGTVLGAPERRMLGNLYPFDKAAAPAPSGTGLKSIMKVTVGIGG